MRWLAHAISVVESFREGAYYFALAGNKTLLLHNAGCQKDVFWLLKCRFGVVNEYCFCKLAT